LAVGTRNYGKRLSTGIVIVIRIGIGIGIGTNGGTGNEHA
jgi:hypothetical protein